MKKISTILLFCILSIGSAYAQSVGGSLDTTSPTPYEGEILLNDNITLNDNSITRDNITVNNDILPIDNATKTAETSAEDYVPPAQPDNPGYLKSHGMVGIYGFLPDFHSKSMRDNDPGGGGFIYYNLYNAFWGNVMMGLSSDYTSTRLVRGNYKANTTLAPVTLNMAYMTSSDTVNFWGGVGASFTFMNSDIREVTGVGGGLHKKVLTTFWATDLFIGGEYIFTDFSKEKFGVFFEFRYTFTQPVNLKADFGNARINDTMTMQRFKYILGFAYHF